MQSMQALGKDFVQTIVTITIVVMACSNLSEARLLMNCSGEVVEEAESVMQPIILFCIRPILFIYIIFF